MDKKTSEFDAASQLSGPDIVGIVQDGADKQATLGAIKAFATGYSGHVRIGTEAAYGEATKTVSIGYHAIAYGNRSIALGYFTYVGGPNSIAIGTYAYTNSVEAIAIGVHARAVSDHSIAIGYSAYADLESNSALAIGHMAHSQSDNTVALGSNATSFSGGITLGFQASSQYGGLALGAYTQAHGNRGIAIGGEAATCNASASIAIGYQSISGFANYSIAIGFNAFNNSDAHYSIAIGNRAGSGGYGSVTIGARATTVPPDEVTKTYAIAIGYHANAPFVNGIAIGQSAYSAGSYAIAVGKEVTANDLTVAIGNRIMSSTYNVSIGQYLMADNNSVVIGTGIYAQHGSVGIGYGVRSYVNSISIGGQSEAGPYGVAIGYRASAGVYGIALGHTTADMQASISIGQGSGTLAKGCFVVSGMPTTLESGLVIPLDTSFKLTGYTTDMLTSCTMTSDGDILLEENCVAARTGSIGMLSGTVVGWQANTTVDGASDQNDYAAFTLPPVLMYRNDIGDYVLVGEYEFSLMSASSGGSTWSVPTLNIIGSGLDSLVSITVADQSTGAITWLAFLTLQTNI
jgi:hypothetical protein